MPSKVRYQALGPLMSGEGSRAFLGLQIAEDNRALPVVLVWVPEATAGDSALVAKLHAETVRAAALQHPNIIRVHGLVAVEEGLARVVEFADGEPLRRVLDVSGSLPERFAALVVAEVAMGVHFAHLTGNTDGTPLVHGDVRPETVMVSFSGVCKMSGYGALGVAPKESGGKRVKGRRMHCAPEQLAGGREAASKETDVYLLGLLLYECLTGLLPFGDEADFDQAVLTKPLDLNREAIPERLKEVLAKATAKRAPERYRTALAFREAVERAVGGLAASDELSAYLRPFFPEADAIRAARRLEIDTGIAELARRQWEESGRVGPPPSAPKRSPIPPLRPPAPPPRSAPPPPPPRPHVESRPPEPEPLPRDEPIPPPPPPPERPRAERRPAPAPAPVFTAPPPVPAFTAPPPAPAFTAPPPAHAAPPPAHAAPPPALAAPSAAAPAPSARRSWLVPALVGASLAFGAAGTFFGVMQSGKQPAAAPAPVAPAPAVAEAKPDPKPVAVADARSAAAPTVVAAKAAEPPKPPPEPPSLELSVSPPVEVSIDGKSVGRAPVKLPLDAGKHSISLVDSALGIRLNRSVTVGREGKTRQSISIGKATVALSAPPGVSVFMDGRMVGKAPVDDISVYEGSHSLKVMLGQAKWQQSFSVKPGDHMMFNVQTTGP